MILYDIVGQRQRRDTSTASTASTHLLNCSSCSSPGSPGCRSLLRLSRDRLASQLQIAWQTWKLNKTCKPVKTILSSGTPKLFQGRTLNKPHLLPKRSNERGCQAQFSAFASSWQTLTRIPKKDKNGFLQRIFISLCLSQYRGSVSLKSLWSSVTVTKHVFSLCTH